MIYEFIATIAAGFGMAGVALLVKHLVKLTGKTAPKWLVPVFAAIGIFGFQLHQEYHWYEQQVNRLPEGVEVVKAVQDSAWFRPWSYVKPQTVRFMAVDVGNGQTNRLHPQQHFVNLYLFERRMSAQVVPQVIDCAQNARADVVATAGADNDRQSPQISDWVALDSSDPLLTQVCKS